MTTINLNNSVTMKLFNVVMANTIHIGNKVFALIPLDLLAVGDYQRTDFYNKEKVTRLAANFNRNLMDPITVCAHPEEGLFYVVNGMHRKGALEILGEESVECEILQNMSNDPEERRRQEADIFRKQMADLDPISPVAMHKANIICGDKSSIMLDDAVKKYGFLYKTNNNKGRCAANTLTGFTAALRTVKISGKETLEDIFYVLKNGLWNEESGGLSALSISVLRCVFDYNPGLSENKDLLVKIYKEYPPKLLEAKARAKYEYRSAKVAEALFIEDMLAGVIAIDNGVHNKYKVDSAA